MKPAEEINQDSHADDFMEDVADGVMKSADEMSDDEFRDNVVSILEEQAKMEADDFQLEGQTPDELSGEDEQPEPHYTHASDDESLDKLELLLAQDNDELHKTIREIQNELLGPANRRKQANDEVGATLSKGEVKGLCRHGVKLGHGSLKKTPSQVLHTIITWLHYLHAHGFFAQTDWVDDDRTAKAVKLLQKIMSDL